MIKHAVCKKKPPGPHLGRARGQNPTLPKALVAWLVGLTLVTLGSVRPDEAAAARRHPPGHFGLEVGYLAPDFALPDLEGKVRRLSDFKGKVVLLNFWSTWCQPCRDEMPSMQRAFEQHNRHGLEIVAVSLNVEGKPVVEEFVQEFNLTFPVLLDPKKEAGRLYRIYALPTSFLVDPEGGIAYKLIGAREWDTEASWQLIQRILRGETGS